MVLQHATLTKQFKDVLICCEDHLQSLLVFRVKPLMFESEKMTEEGVEVAEEDQDPGPEAEEELGDLRPTHLPGRGAGVGEEAETEAKADQEKGTGAASRDQEIGPGPGPAPRLAKENQ